MTLKHNIYSNVFLLSIILTTTAYAVSVKPELTPKEIYQKHAKAVALIMASHKGKKNNSIGAGSIIMAGKKNSMERLVLTNAHVIFDEYENRPFSYIRVFLKPEKVVGRWKDDLKKRYTAHIVTYDLQLDLALLKVNGDIGDTIIQLADSNRVEVGDPVVAIGHPEQGGLWTLTTGMISAQKAGIDKVEGKDVFQTDASINRGNSGGPLLNLSGELVGVNTSIVRRAADGMAITGINFALKSGTVKTWLRKTGHKGPDTKATLAKLERVEEFSSKQKSIIKEQPKVKAEEKEALPEGKKKGGEILTQKRPYRFDDLIDFLMKDMEDSIDRAMEKMWKKW